MDQRKRDEAGRLVADIDLSGFFIGSQHGYWTVVNRPFVMLNKWSVEKIMATPLNKTNSSKFRAAETRG